MVLKSFFDIDNMRQDVDIGIKKWISISRYQILEKQGGTEKNNLWPETFEGFKNSLESVLNNKRLKSILFYDFFTDSERREIDEILNKYRNSKKV